MLSFDLLQFLLQKHRSGGGMATDLVEPAWFSDINILGDPRRAGSSNAIFAGFAAAGAASLVFTVPRTGLYRLEGTLFAEAGAVGRWELVIQDVGANDLLRMRAVSTSQGWRWGPWILYLEAGDIFRITNDTAMGAGDTAVVSIQNFELALA